MAACRPAFTSYPPEDALDHQPATADGAALIYPVITLLPPWSHTATHRLLVGPQASEAADRAWSVQTWVTTATPPCFLVQAQDDPISNPHNTLLMADACRQHQVPVQLFRYTRGGHGFGMGRPGTPTTAWPTAYAAWLKALASTMAQNRSAASRRCNRSRARAAVLAIFAQSDGGSEQICTTPRR